MADKTNKLNIYLIKKNVPLDRIVKSGTASADMGDVGIFYSADSHPAPPSWFSDFFGAGVAFPFRLLTASAKGVLILTMDFEGEEQRVFAVTFGHGRYLLNEGVAEERFGLKIVLNTMVPDSFRSVDRTSLGSVPKQSREQTSRESAVTSFGLDIEQDLVRSVTARSADKRFGKMISGRDALTVSVKYDVRDVKHFLLLCMRQFASAAYKTNYDWIDQIRDVRDPTVVQTLNNDLVERMKSRNLANIWMAAPDIIDWVDIRGFRIGRSQKGALVEDLDISGF